MRSWSLAVGFTVCNFSSIAAFSFVLTSIAILKLLWQIEYISNNNHCWVTNFNCYSAYCLSGLFLDFLTIWWRKIKAECAVTEHIIWRMCNIEKGQNTHVVLTIAYFVFSWRVTRRQTKNQFPITDCAFNHIILSWVL